MNESSMGVERFKRFRAFILEELQMAIPEAKVEADSEGYHFIVNGENRGYVDFDVHNNMETAIPKIKTFLADMTPAQRLKHAKYKKIIEAAFEDVKVISNKYQTEIAMDGIEERGVFPQDAEYTHDSLIYNVYYFFKNLKSEPTLKDGIKVPEHG